ncbi:efflux RND transporter permease subunit [bacterium]|nr:efflux RND transporter permease subunit [bacterium]
MKLPKIAIENHQFTLVMICLLVLAGIGSVLTMPRSEDPPVSPAGSSTIVVYPGASPADIEQLIVDPIEDALNALEDIKVLTSSSMDNIGIVEIEFTAGSDPDEKYAEVVQKVNSIRSQLPGDLLSMEIPKWSISNTAIFQIAFISDSADYAALEYEAERLRKELLKVPGVKEAEKAAVPEQEVRVSVDLPKLALYHIPLTRVMGMLQDANANIPGGYVDIGAKRLNIKTSGSYRSLDDIRNTVVHSAQGKPVFLRDIADVRFMNEDAMHLARVNGERSIFLKLTQKENTNIFQISGRVKDIVGEYQKKIPEAMKLEIVFDQSESVSRRVTGFFSNLLYGLILVGLVVFTAVGFHASMIVMMVIPVSILIGIGFIDLCHFGLEQMSIAGMVIALGLLVDNAIVVTENVARFLKMGYNRVDSAVLGTSQVGWAVVSATATTVLAFVPIIMMQDMTGAFIRSMPVTVVFTLSASLLLSLTLTPYLSEKFLKVSNGHRERPLRRWLNHMIDHVYRRVLDYGLRKPRRFLMATGIVFLLSFLLFPLIGVSMFPKAEKPMFYINVNFPTDTHIEKTDALVLQIEKEMMALPGVKRVLSNSGNGNPPLYYNMYPERNKSYHGQLVVLLKEFKRKEFQKMLQDLRQRYSQIPGVRIEVKELEQGPPVEAPVAIKVLGDNMDILTQLSRVVEKEIRSEQGTVNVRNPLNTTKSDLKIQIHREKAGMLGVPLSEIDRSVRAAITGLPVTQFRDAEGRKYDIVIRLPFDRNKPVLSDLDRIYVASMSGAQIPLKHLISVELAKSPLTIDHYQMNRSVTVTSDVLDEYSVAKITTNIMKRLNRYPWPKGYSLYVAGEQESREESFGGMGKAVIIALVAIFGVLVLQFRSYLQPIIVFTAIPLAIIGSLIALFVTGNSFSFTAFIGITSLVGIVVNNSIILVDYSNQLRREGMSTDKAIREAGETRFIPIILTTLTTVGGLLPLTVAGGTMWAPMGWTIIGGLIVSTFLTLVVVPVLYMLISPKIDG